MMILNNLHILYHTRCITSISFPIESWQRVLKKNKQSKLNFKLIEMEERNLYFMQLAMKEAKKAFEKDEVPIGCVIVHKGKVVAKAHNLVEKRKNATEHAELICIEKASKKLNDFRLNECFLYTTLEPCLMCTGAILLSRIKKIIYAAKDIRHGALVSVFHVFENKHPIHTPQFEQGPLEKESADLLKTFFKMKRAQHGKKN